MDVDIIETSDRDNKKWFINIEKYLKLNDIPDGIIISDIKTTNVLLVNSSTECIQFDVDCNIQLDLKVRLRIIYPKRTGTNQIENPVRLRIHVYDEHIKKEVISCTNYLQRQRNVHLALSILKKCSIFISERKLIYSMLLLHFEGVVDSKPHDDGGMVISCEDRKSGFKFLESLWRIHFNCKEHLVMDFIDFTIARQDRRFYNKSKPAMCVLVEPNLPYKTKVELWSSIVNAANLSIHDSSVVRRWRDDDVLIEEINSNQIITYDLSDSDDDDDNCILID